MTKYIDTYDENGSAQFAQQNTGGEANGLSIVGNIIQSIMTLIAQQHINDAATDKQNDYNSPVNQMKRLTAAGVNPYSVTGQIAGSNTSANRNPAQIRAAEAMQNTVAMLQLRSMRADIRNKELQNDLLSSNLDYQEAKNFYSLRMQSYKILQQRLYNQYLNGQIDLQSYHNQSAFFKSLVDSMMIKRGDGSNALYSALEAYGITDLPEEIPLQAATQAIATLRNSLQASFEKDTYDTNVNINQKRYDFLVTQVDFLEEQLRHAMTMNDKTEKWFVFQQVMQAAAQMFGMFSTGVGAARGINLIQNNPYAQ